MINRILICIGPFQDGLINAVEGMQTHTISCGGSAEIVGTTADQRVTLHINFPDQISFAQWAKDKTEKGTTVWYELMSAIRERCKEVQQK